MTALACHQRHVACAHQLSATLVQPRPTRRFNTCNKKPALADQTRSRIHLCASSGDSSTPPGKCWLVGAGPGSDDYLTLKALRVLQSADVVVYDDLGAQSVLQHAPSSAELLYVGKRGGKASIKQPEIDELLVQLCTQGRSVVRLKGGCPSVFSRVASELAALRQAGVEAEMVPGISSALAAPVLAGFPLTDVALGPSFAVTSGHDVEGTDWSAFSKVATLVVLMAGRSLAAISERLQATGWAASTPVAVIRAAGTAEQRVWVADLGSVVEVTAGQQLSPCITVVGQVVGLAGLQGGGKNSGEVPGP